MEAGCWSSVWLHMACFLFLVFGVARGGTQGLTRARQTLPLGDSPITLGAFSKRVQPSPRSRSDRLEHMPCAPIPAGGPAHRWPQSPSLAVTHSFVPDVAGFTAASNLLFL